ncbi:hypothetical protein [Spiroplasma endosymbiont of Panorpa germanica]|uniref:hypothetical protein n=1 Tax=Spiroplasma endosymbiont of Panorpa germanica TaxID=3066314 RepID=UPI0030D15C57
MQNELKIVKEENSLDKKIHHKPGPAYSKFLIRIAKRQKYFLISAFIIGLLFGSLFPFLYLPLFKYFIEDEKRLVEVYRLVFLMLNIVASISLIGTFFQKIFFENRNTVVFKRVALTGISKKSFLILSSLVIFLYAFTAYLISIISFTVGAAIFIDNGLAKIYSSWNILRDLLIYLFCTIAFIGFLFVIFSLTHSVTIAKIMTIPFVLINLFVFSMVVLNLDIEMKIMNLIMWIYLLFLICLAIIFWFIAYKKFRFHF